MLLNNLINFYIYIFLILLLLLCNSIFLIFFLCKLVRLASTDSYDFFCPGPRIRLQPGCGLIHEILRKVSPFKPQLLQGLKNYYPITYKMAIFLDKIVGVLLTLCAFFFIFLLYKQIINTTAFLFLLLTILIVLLIYIYKLRIKISSSK